MGPGLSEGLEPRVWNTSWERGEGQSLKKGHKDWGLRLKQDSGQSSPEIEGMLR